MVVVTGAAGFIGSVLIEALNKKGIEDIIAVDAASKLNHTNLKELRISSFIPREKFADELKNDALEKPEIIFHIGARTDTTETDVTLFEKLNVQYSKNVWDYCTQKQIPLIYASSAATYGDGSHGYSDDVTKIPLLAPLNPYGWSKQYVDQWVLQQKECPPKWAGFKFFNVFGPKEYHKGRMASVVFHGYQQIKNKGSMRLFKSNDPGIPDGMQKRDFIYVKDVVDTLINFAESKAPNDIYNLGSGQAHSFIDLARGVFHSMELEENIEFIPMPADLQKTYQNFTEADMKKTIEAGIFKNNYSFESAIEEYVKLYLSKI